MTAAYKLGINRLKIHRYLISIPVNGKNKHLALQFNYNLRGAFWNVTITDVSDDTVLVANAPLVIANSGDNMYSLMVQFDYMNIGQLNLVPITQEALDLQASFSNFEKNFRLVWEV